MRRQRRGDSRHLDFVVPGHTGVDSRQRGQAIQRAAVEIMIAEVLGHERGDRTLAGSRGTVDCNHRRCDPGEVGKVAGIGFGHAARVVDHQRHATQADQRKAHRHAVIIVGVDGDIALENGRRHHRKIIRARLHRGAELGKFGRHGRDPVSLLDPPAGDIAQGGNPIGEQREHRQGHRRIGYVIDIGVDGSELAASGRADHDMMVAQVDFRTHLLQHLGETQIALDAAPADAVDAHRAAGYRSGGEEIRSRRGIAFDGEQARAFAALPGRNGELLPAGTPDLDAEARHQVQGDLDVGLGDQLSDHLDFRRPAGQGQGHQQRRQELRGDVAAHPDPALPAGIIGSREDGQRRIAFGAQVADVGTQAAQGINEVGNRPLVHARHAGEAVMPAGERQRSGKRAESGTGIAQEEIRLLDRETAGNAKDAVGIGAAGDDGDAQRRQGGEHHPRVFRLEQAADLGLAAGQGREQKAAIGNAFRSRQPDRAGRPTGRG